MAADCNSVPLRLVARRVGFFAATAQSPSGGKFPAEWVNTNHGT